MRTEPLPFERPEPCTAYVWWAERWQDHLCQRCGRWEFDHALEARRRVAG